MKRFVLLSVVLSFVAAVQADTTKKMDPKEMMAKVAEAGKPGAEHKKLDPLVGKFTFVCKCFMDPTNPIETTGTVERKWVLGDRFIEEKYEGQGFGGQGKFEGCGIIGYDNATKKFTYGWLDNMNTGLSVMNGTVDPSGKVWTFEKTDCVCPMTNDKYTGRSVLKLEGKDKIIYESYIVNGGKEVKMMEVVTVRKS